MCLRFDLQQVSVFVCVCLCKGSHHTSQFGVELPSKWLDQVYIVTAWCFKQHLKGLESVVCYTVHWERRKMLLFQVAAHVLLNVFYHFTTRNPFNECAKNHTCKLCVHTGNHVHWNVPAVMRARCTQWAVSSSCLCCAYLSSRVCLESRVAPKHHCRRRSSCALHPEWSCSHPCSEEYS